jgi:hypothetical protein
LVKPEGEMWVSMSVAKAMTGSQTIGSILVRPYNFKDIKKMEEQAKKGFSAALSQGRDLYWE